MVIPKSFQFPTFQRGAVMARAIKPLKGTLNSLKWVSEKTNDIHYETDAGYADKRSEIEKKMNTGALTEREELNKAVVFVVEDDVDIASFLRFLFQRQGYQTLLAPDGRQAVKFINGAQPPSVVLLDIMLPYMNGLQLVTYIRCKPGWGGVPIVMLTANSTERGIVCALDAGANDYVIKPFNPQELMARVRRFLQSSF